MSPQVQAAYLHPAEDTHTHRNFHFRHDWFVLHKNVETSSNMKTIIRLFSRSSTLNLSYPSLRIILPGARTSVHLQTNVNAILDSNKHSE